MQTISYICFFLVVLSVLYLVVGLIKPSLVVPAGVKKKRPFVVIASVVAFIVFAMIGANTDQSQEADGNEQPLSTEQADNEVAITVPDSLLAEILKHEFDSLYTRYQNIDILDPAAHDRGGEIKKMQHLVLDTWWGFLEEADSAHTDLPICKKEYDIAYRKLDKAYGRYLIYGNEYEEDVKLWAKSEAQRILPTILRDPKSLEIIEVSSCTMTSKGYKCKVKYRAKNGFGGYNVDQVELLMAFDADNYMYKCIDAK